MRISDWSSDVCSSDLEGNTLLAVGCGHIFVHLRAAVGGRRQAGRGGARHQGIGVWPALGGEVAVEQCGAQHILRSRIDRKSVVSGTSVSGRVDLGGRHLIKYTIQPST